MSHNVAFQVVKLLVDLGSLKSTLGKALGILGYIEGILEVVKLSVELPQIIIVLAELDDVSQDAPVVEVGSFSV